MATPAQLRFLFATNPDFARRFSQGFAKKPKEQKPTKPAFYKMKQTSPKHSTITTKPRGLAKKTKVTTYQPGVNLKGSSVYKVTTAKSSKR